MKKAIIALAFFGMLFNLSLQAEPFNNRGTDYIERAPVGSSASRQMAEPKIGPFKRRGNDYSSTAPTGSSQQPLARFRPEIQGFNDRSANPQLY
jgi:hypothetical protein